MRHVGNVREGLKQLFQWLTADRKPVIAQAKKMIEAASHDKMGRDDDKITEYLVSKGFLKGVALKALTFAHDHYPGKELSRWNVVWGLTRASQEFDMDRRYEIDVEAGKLLAV